MRPIRFSPECFSPKCFLPHQPSSHRAATNRPRPRPIRIAACAAAALLAASAAQAHAGYFELINRSGDSIVAVAASRAGTAAFADKPIGAPLAGDGGATTIELAGPDCRYDLRLSLRDGRVLEYADIDVCRHRALRVKARPRREPAASTLATQP